MSSPARPENDPELCYKQKMMRPPQALASLDPFKDLIAKISGGRGQITLAGSTPFCHFWDGGGAESRAGCQSACDRGNIAENIPGFNKWHVGGLTGHAVC